MANENMEEYRTGPAIIDETVRVAKKYLEEHPEEKKKILPHGKESSEVMEAVDPMRLALLCLPFKLWPDTTGISIAAPWGGSR